MIVVVGEALVDLVVETSGEVTATLGGAPFNTARACGRLGAEVAFAGAISGDRFGSMLRQRLVADGVATASVQACAAPTTLAVAELDGSGSATYRFYVDGTSAPTFDATWGEQVPSLLFTGGLALVLEPLAGTVETMLDTAPDECAVIVDVNSRPSIVPDRERHRERVRRVLGAADAVKVSDEDLAYLAPSVAPLSAARGLLHDGPRAVLLTSGASAVHVLTSHGEATVPVPPVAVVDTIGAGDSFGGGLLAYWQLAGHGKADLASLDRLVPAVEAAIAVAGVVCGRRGAEPPWRHELPRSWAPSA